MLTNFQGFKAIQSVIVVKGYTGIRPVCQGDKKIKKKKKALHEDEHQGKVGKNHVSGNGQEIRKT